MVGLLLALVQPGGAAADIVGLEAALEDAAPVRIGLTPVEITGGELAGLRLTGAWALTGDHRAFGGFSGLAVRGGRLLAVSDIGWWLEARLDETAGLRLGDARMAPMRGSDGAGYDKSGGDAEDLALDGDAVAVSFERDHRVMWLGADGRLGQAVRARAFEALRSNKGLEALTALADGTLLAVTEDAGDPVPMFRIARNGTVTQSRLPRAGAHAITGADLGPDGRLYLVLRDYSPIFGVSIRVMRYSLGADGWPVPDSAEVLAAYEAASGIDNMEGIALAPAPGGGTELWLISDDNFNLLQRTLLMRFALEN